MTLQAHTVSDLIKHAVGGREPSKQVGGMLDIQNRAGPVLFNMYTWDFNLRIAKLDKVAGQDYLELPSDFGELDVIEATDTLTNHVQITTLDELLRQRTYTLDNSNWNYYGAVVFVDNADTKGGAPLAQFAIHPTPQSAETDAFTCVYRRRWPKLENDNDQVGVPEYAEELYIQVCREMAKGYEGDRLNDGTLTLADRISKIKASWLFEDAKARDGRSQVEYGQIINGHIDAGLVTRDWGINSSVGGPS